MRTSFTVCAVIWLCAASAVVSQSHVFVCDSGSGYGYSPNATFRNVFINSSISYTFSCGHSNGYKTTIDFEDSTLDDVPKRLFDTFTQLKNATLSGCNIQHINRYSLEQAKYLQILDVSHNALEEVKNYAFTGASNLVVLNLSFNRIGTIDATAFAMLSQLRVLYLQGNKLRQLDQTLFSGLGALRHIFLDRNELQLIEASLFEMNNALENVILNDNQISVVDEDAFTGSTLKLLSLRNNRLAKLNMRNVRAKKVLLGNNSLEELYLSPWVEVLYAENNRLSLIEADRTKDIAIQTLSLENNSISSIDMVNWMHTLTVLDLTHNTLGALNISSFAKLTNLQQLRLERTGIRNLQHGTFAQLEKLSWLDLSYNNLATLDVDILTSSSGLKTLYLDGNRLKSIDFANMKKMFPELAELGLENNRWNCTFLSAVVRYCNEQGIRLTKIATSGQVPTQTNVKGIYCYDDKNPIQNWNTTVQHLLGANVSETGALQSMLQSVLDDVRRFGEDHSDTANRTGQLEDTLAQLTRRQLSQEGDVLELRKSILDLRLSLLSNRTNASTVGSDELRRMINGVNNLTLEKQQLSEERLGLKLNAQSYRLDQALEAARENADKLTVLGRRVEQWISRLLSPDGPVGYLAADKQHGQLQQQQQHSTADATGASHGEGLLIAVLVMVCLLTVVLAFSLLRMRRQLYAVERRRYANRDSSLTTIVDNDI